MQCKKIAVILIYLKTVHKVFVDKLATQSALDFKLVNAESASCEFVFLKNSSHLLVSNIAIASLQFCLYSNGSRFVNTATHTNI